MKKIKNKTRKRNLHADCGSCKAASYNFSHCIFAPLKLVPLNEVFIC